MRALISSITMVAVLLHVLLGCHAHQSHAVEQGLFAAVESAYDSCGYGSHDHDSGPSQTSTPHEEFPCDGDSDCSFTHAKFEGWPAATGYSLTFAFVSPTYGLPSCSCNGRPSAGQECPPPACGAPVLFCALRN